MVALKTAAGQFAAGDIKSAAAGLSFGEASRLIAAAHPGARGE